MKKLFSLLFSVILLPVILFMGCDSKIDNEYYYDETGVNISDIDLEFTCSEYNIRNINLTIRVLATNTNTQDKTVCFKNIKVVNEKTKVEYNAVSTPSLETTLQYNIKTRFDITAIIPTSYKAENYYLKFSLLGKICIVKLYSESELP